MAPDKQSLIELNSTFIVLHLLSWKSRGCQIQGFVVQYKERGRLDWTLASNHVVPTMDLFTISGLRPAKWYSLKIAAQSDAGTTGE